MITMERSFLSGIKSPRISEVTGLVLEIYQVNFDQMLWIYFVYNKFISSLVLALKCFLIQVLYFLIGHPKENGN